MNSRRSFNPRVKSEFLNIGHTHRETSNVDPEEKTIQAFVFKDVKGYFMELGGQPFLNTTRIGCSKKCCSIRYIGEAIRYVSNICDPDDAIDILILAVYEYLHNSVCNSEFSSMKVLEFQLSYILDTSLGTMNPETRKGVPITEARRIMTAISDKMFKIDNNHILHINMDCLYGETKEVSDIRSLLFSRLAPVT